MKRKLPEFMKDADNVYRTRDYIVKQRVGVRYDKKENNIIFSYDTFYRRTKKRDAEYEQIFFERKRIDGKRLPTAMYARTYID